MTILRGVVKDHRLPRDYTLAMNQPMTSKAFLKDFKRTIATRMITKQYATVPLLIFFAVGCPYFVI